MITIEKNATLEDFHKLKSGDLVNERNGKSGEIINIQFIFYSESNTDDVVITLRSSEKIIRSFPR